LSGDGHEDEKNSECGIAKGKEKRTGQMAKSSGSRDGPCPSYLPLFYAARKTMSKRRKGRGDA
jgi:hypothetical protein